MITRERFEQGLTWDEYMGGIQKNQDLFKVKYEEVEISPEDRAFFQGIKKPICPSHWGRLVPRCLQQPAGHGADRGAEPEHPVAHFPT